MLKNWEKNFVRGYIACALWSSTYTEEDGSTLELDNGQYDLSLQAVRKLIRTCKQFLQDEEILLAASASRISYSWEHAGHDFWLSHNGHGSGYFDNDALPQGWRDSLQHAAERVLGIDLYVGDDGKIYA